MEVRKSTIVTVVVLVLLAGGGYLALNNPFSTGAGVVEKLALSFLEDLQFKDFRESALYSHPLDQDRLDIGKTLERLFHVKPEFLDILDYRIMRTEVDRDGRRAKVLVKTRYKVLNRKKRKQDRETKEADMILYWLKRHPDCPQGGTCPAEGKCVNEVGEVIYKPVKDTKVSDSKTSRVERERGWLVASDEPYACDPAKEDEWFMNLDSSLKGEEYRDAKTE